MAKALTPSPSVDTRTLKGGETYRRREMPADVELGAHRPGPRDQNRDADADYFGNLKKFERHDNMAAEPTRSKAGEPGQKKK